MSISAGEGALGGLWPRAIPQRSLTDPGGGGWHGHTSSGNDPPSSRMLGSTGPLRNDARPHFPGEDVDGMSYERLLEVFGDGTENRGASPEDVASLPVAEIRDPDRELPGDARRCSICLEDFRRGEERTSLPCLHGFHSGCVGRWLVSNGSCPVCKTSIKGHG